MKLVLVLMFVASTTSDSPNISFEKPRYSVSPWEIPNIFPLRSNNVQKYPLAVEAVISVALKLQAIEDHDGRQRNFLVSPLAIAGALGQLLLGARGDLRKQIAVLLTLRDGSENRDVNTSAVPVQPQVMVNPGGTVQQRMSLPVAPSSVKGSGSVVSRFGTVSALNAGSYESRPLRNSQFATKSRDGVPGLELHRQLGALIHDLSIPLPLPGVVHPVTNSSYLHSSSAFFIDHKMSLNEPFVHAIMDFYHSRVVPLDFSNNPTGAQNTVNSWGSTETGGLISNFLPYPAPLDTAVIQAVAVHFRGAWQTPFIPEGTIPGVFQTSANTQVPVEYMRGSFEQAHYAEDAALGLRLLAMPYANFDCAMYVVLPMDSNPLKYNVGHLVSKLTSKELADLVGKSRERTVNVMFPKLSLTGSLSLVSALEKHAAFLNKQKADQAAINSANSTAEFTARGANFGGTETPTANQPIPSINPRTGANIPVQSTEEPLRVIPLGGQEPATNTENVQISPRYGASHSHDTSAKPALVLTGAAANSKFRVSDIIQQIALEVTEAGTEAAAVVASTINYSGDVKNFKVNRPFLFFIRQEETNALLFWGTIVDPTAQ